MLCLCGCVCVVICRKVINTELLGVLILKHTFIWIISLVPPCVAASSSVPSIISRFFILSSLRWDANWVHFAFQVNGSYIRNHTDSTSNTVYQLNSTFATYLKIYFCGIFTTYSLFFHLRIVQPLLCPYISLPHSSIHTSLLRGFPLRSACAEAFQLVLSDSLPVIY